MEVILSTGRAVNVAAMTFEEDTAARRMAEAIPPACHAQPETVLAVVRGCFKVAGCGMVRAGATDKETRATLDEMSAPEVVELSKMVFEITSEALNPKPAEDRWGAGGPHPRNRIFHRRK